MNRKNNTFVALTKCYFCTKDNYIILRRDLGDASEFHQKVVDMTPCTECAEHMKQGIIIITIDTEKSEKGWDKNKLPNPYRTGGFFVITEEGFLRITEGLDALQEFGLKNRWMFIEHAAAEQMGFFEHKTEE